MDLRYEVIRRVWRFHYLDGKDVWWLMQLAPNGTILNYDHPNERNWTIDAGDVCLLNESGEVSSRFDVVTEKDCRIQLVGQHILSDPPVKVALTGYHPYTTNLPSRLCCHVRSEIGRPSDVLVVALNGRGYCFDGNIKHTQFEITGFGPSLDADTVHIAEHEKRCAWYADKADHVAERIRAISTGYRHVLFIGLSSGGYGAILLAEKLAESIIPQCTSIAINPQTSLLAEHLESVAQKTPARLQPPTISEEARQNCVEEYLHLPSLVSSGPGAAKHNIFFDSENPAESYHASLLEDLPTCRLIGLPLGLGHALGSAHIYQTALPKKLAQEIIAAA